MSKETRLINFRNISNEEMILEGYAAVFGEPTVLYTIDGKDYKEVLDRSCFDNTNFKDCCLKYNHESSIPILARVRGGSLEIKVDNRGLFFRAKLIGTQAAKDVYTLVREGALDKCSFAFTIAPNGDQYNRDTRTRTIKAIDRCFDLSIVDIPAYESTSVQARSFFELEAQRDKAHLMDRIDILKLKYEYIGE